MNTLLFVYGTLKRGGVNHTALATQCFVGTACTAPGFCLFSIGNYPGMVAWEQDRTGVVGEVWSVDAATLVRLDELEGLDEGLYRRELVPLLSPFADQIVQTYIFAQSVKGRREIGGEWPVSGP